jgi:hypothetical protein
MRSLQFSWTSKSQQLSVISNQIGIHVSHRCQLATFTRTEYYPQVKQAIKSVPTTAFLWPLSLSCLRCFWHTHSHLNVAYQIGLSVLTAAQCRHVLCWNVVKRVLRTCSYQPDRKQGKQSPQRPSIAIASICRVRVLLFQLSTRGNYCLENQSSKILLHLPLYQRPPKFDVAEIFQIEGKRLSASAVTRASTANR